MTYGAEGPATPTGGAATWLHAEGSPGAVAPAVGWTPPPRPGLVPLRPLSFSDLLTATFRLFRTSPQVTVGTSIVVTLLTNILAAVIPLVVGVALFGRVESAAPEDRSALESTAVTGTLLSAIVPIGLAYIGSMLVQGVLVVVVNRATLGERTTLGVAVRAAWKRIVPLMLYGLLVLAAPVVAVAIPVALMVVPVVAGLTDASLAGFVVLGITLLAAMLVGLLALQIKLLFVPAAIVTEHVGVRDAIRRSWTLTTGHFWRLLGITLLVAFLVNMASSSVSSVLQFAVMLVAGVLAPLGGSEEQLGVALVAQLVLILLALVLQVVLQAVGLVLIAGNSSLLYLDVRMRKEGLNLQLSAHREAAAAGAAPDEDPFRRTDLGPQAGPEAARKAAPAWGPPPAGYGQPPAGYGQAPAGYGPPPAGYEQAPAAYGQAPTGYGPPPAGYGPPPAGNGQAPSAYGPPPAGNGQARAGYGPPPAAPTAAPSSTVPSSPVPSSPVPTDPTRDARLDDGRFVPPRPGAPANEPPS